MPLPAKTAWVYAEVTPTLSTPTGKIGLCFVDDTGSVHNVSGSIAYIAAFLAMGERALKPGRIPDEAGFPENWRDLTEQEREQLEFTVGSLLENRRQPTEEGRQPNALH